MTVKSRMYVSALLVILQWTFSILISFKMSGLFDLQISQSGITQIHCSAHIFTPTQYKPLFFVLCGFQVFALFIHTFFACNHNSMVSDFARFYYFEPCLFLSGKAEFAEFK